MSKFNGKTVLDFTIGADPEFLMCRGSTVTQGAKEVTESDEFGYDGNKITYENRPDPSNHPIEVVHNMRGIFVRQVLRSPKFLSLQWLAGSYQKGYPLGGHIHFGIKKERIEFTKACNILSQYVGAITLLLEDRAQGLSRRKEKQYGGIEDMREQTYGFEYRTPSSWLASPYVAAGVMCLAKAVMFEVLNNDKFRPPTRIKNDHFMNGDDEGVRVMFPEIWNEITKMMLYQPFKPYLDVLYFLVTNKQTWFPKCSMKQAWGIVDMKTSLSSKMELDAIWSRFIEERAVAAANKRVRC